MIRLEAGWRQPYFLRLVLCLASVLAAGAASTALAQQTRLQRLQRVQAAKRTLLDANPGVRLHQRAGRVTRVYGRAFSFGRTPVDAAEAFRLAYADLFGVSPADLQPMSLLADQRPTQPLMYDPLTGAYKFTLVYYTQSSSGIPVFRADLRILARNLPESPVVMAASGLRDLGGFAVDADSLKDLAQPAFVGNRFTDAKQAVIAAVPGLVNFSVPRVVVWAGLNDMKVTPRVALTFIGDNFAPNAASNEKWRFVTDIATGAILHREFILYRIDGNAGGNATEGIGSDECEDEVPIGLPHLLITSGANSTIADVNGDFTIVPDGATVDATLSGNWFDTFNNFLGPEVSESVPASMPANLFFNSANTSEFERAQVNGYLGANVVRDFAASHHPTYPTLDDTNIVVRVNRTDAQICPGNAFYDPADSSSPTFYSINFCASGNIGPFSFPNTAWSSVIYHEFGHHLVHAAGSGQGQYGEGLGDVMSVLILDDSRIGLGFFDGCGAPSVLRDANNTIQYPCVGSIHDCGQLLAGCIWDTRNALMITNPGTYLDILGNLAIDSILLHQGDLITPQITTDFLTLDDDDTDLSNGTPHSVEILAGFGAHNMIPPQRPANDDCANAISISAGTRTYDTTSALTDGQAHPAECGDIGDGGQTYHDIWYSYVAPCSGTLTITTCEQLGGSAAYDTDLVIYNYDGVNCGSRSLLACNDDDPNNLCGGDPGFHSTIRIAVARGGAYLIRVGGWNEGRQGAGTLLLANDGSPCCQDTDDDGDGVTDCDESCPDDPLKLEPGACGCGLPDTDTEGDGVPDCLDNCPDTPNADQADTDGDGVGDACRCQKPGAVKANVGDDLVLNVGESKTLGGGPTAVGGVPPYLYQWSIQGVDKVESSTSIHPLFIAEQPGTFTANLVVTDSSGCASSASLNIVVNGSGPAVFFTDSPCAEDLCGMGGMAMPLTLIGIGWLKRRQRASRRS